MNLIKAKVLNYCADAYLASTSETAKNPLCVENFECPEYIVYLKYVECME